MVMGSRLRDWHRGTAGGEHNQRQIHNDRQTRDRTAWISEPMSRHSISFHALYIRDFLFCVHRRMLRLLHNLSPSFIIFPTPKQFLH